MPTLEEPSVGLRELRHHASEVTFRGAQGKTIVVTEHGAPVARLVPFERPAILARLAPCLAKPELTPAVPFIVSDA